MIWRTAGLVCLLMVAAPFSARAGSQPPAPPAEELVTQALSQSPGIAALEARVRAAQELIRPAGALPNPMLDVMLQDAGFPDWTVGTMEMSMIGPRLTQGIPFPGKRDARRDVARAEVRVRGGELDELRRQVALEIRTNYAGVYALDHEAQSLEAGAQLLNLLGATVNERYAAGQAGQEAPIKVQLALSRLRERQASLASERATFVAGLNRLLDRPGDSPLGEVDTLSAPTMADEPWEAAAEARSAAVLTRREALKAAEARVHAARVERRPDLSATAGVGFRGKLDPVVTLGVGIELPLWNGQSKAPLVRAALEELEAARQEVREAEATARSEAARIAARSRTADQQIFRYQQGVIPQTSLAFDAARSAYLTGSGDFSTVIEDFNMWLDARAALARFESDRYAAWAELEALLIAPGATHPAGK